MNLPTKEELATKLTAPFPSHTSLGLLRKAVDTQEQRAKDYNTPGGERSMQHTVDMFNAITQRFETEDRRCITESEGWLFMMCLKFAREAQAGDPYDSLLDLTSYSALYGESRLKAKTCADAGAWTGVANFGKAPEVTVAADPNPGDAWTYTTVIRGSEKDATPEAARPSDDYAFRERMITALVGIKDKFGHAAARQILVYGAGVKKMADVPADKIANVLGICEMLDAAKPIADWG